MNVELLVDAQAIIGEGPLWRPREQKLYWVDIDGRTLHVHDPNGEADRAIPLGRRIGVAVSRAGGGMLIAGEGGIFSFDPGSGAQQLLADPEAGMPDMRFNDGKCDPLGRFWAGTYNMLRTPKMASLYRFDTDLSLHRMLGDVTTSNGLDWSLDGQTFYHIDTPTQEVCAFDYEATTGSIANRRAIVRIPPEEGRPDGMTLDAEGMIWVAHFDGGRVTRWNPRDGRLLSTVMMPCSRVTSCAFGGSRYDRLFITTARKGLDEAALKQQPHAGGLFAVEPGVVGRPPFEFAG